MISILNANSPFPPLDHALVSPNGLLAAGSDLSVSRLLSAYRNGIFPWFNEDEPILWWSPDPRMVLFPDELNISRSLAKLIRKNNYTIQTDTHFVEVMQACAAPRKDQHGTWIHPEIIDAYSELHRLGLAHSVETWIDGELSGGLYGIALGKIFFGESMFSRSPDASKIAFAYLVRQLSEWEFALIDCQVRTAHLASLGAREIPRTVFRQLLEQHIQDVTYGEKWNFGNLVG
jgi:leucyl/phenylalanyl-tRNA---protein transferase